MQLSGRQIHCRPPLYSVLGLSEKTIHTFKVWLME